MYCTCVHAINAKIIIEQIKQIKPTVRMLHIISLAFSDQKLNDIRLQDDTNDTEIIFFSSSSTQLEHKTD